MIKIEKVNSETMKNAVEFLTSVPSIDKLDENILNNACIAYDNEKIVGCISFEEFSDKGLIRYFVFKKVLSLEFLEMLLKALERSAREKELHSLVCIAECNQIEELFRSLDFKDVATTHIFINEEPINNTSFKNATFLQKDLISL